MRQMKNLETASGDLCRDVRRNPAELAGQSKFVVIPPAARRRSLEIFMRVLIKNGIVVNADGQANRIC